MSVPPGPDDPFEYDDAAYVMGALSPQERAAFEAHLATCDECTRRVAELTGVPDLLRGVTEEELLGTDEPVPDTLLPGLLRRAGLRQRRQRWLTAGLGAVAAAAVAALVVSLTTGSSGHTTTNTTTTTTTASRSLVAVRPTDLAVRATLVDKKWGTEIDLRCSYRDPGSAVFGLRIVDTSGHTLDGSTWAVWTGTTNYIANVPLPRDHIARVEVVDDRGRQVMGANV